MRSALSAAAALGKRASGFFSSNLSMNFERYSGQSGRDRKSTRLNSSHTVIYTLSLHDALPIYAERLERRGGAGKTRIGVLLEQLVDELRKIFGAVRPRSEEHTSELQSHSDLHSFPTRRSSDLCGAP